MGVDLTVAVRPVEVADEEFSLSVYASTRADELALVDWTDEQKAAFVQMQFDAQRQSYLYQYPQAQFYIIEEAGRRAGRMIVARSADSILLMDIALLPEFRGRGIGSVLLRELIEEADHANKTVQLHIEPFNRAIELYSRLGFIKSGQIGYYFEMTRQPKAEAHA